MTEVHHGMKRLTIENWNEPDPTLALIVATSDEWARLFLKPQLGPGVPADVVKLFEAARGAIIYGYQFYPLFTLGTEQVLRIMETAINRKCAALGLVPSRDNFDERIKVLHNHNEVSDADAAMLQVIRHLRNDASHPTEQMIITPGIALGMVENITAQINLLFP